MRFLDALFVTVVAAIGIGAASICYSDEIPALPVTPSQTTVLILPILDDTGDRPEMQKEHKDFGNHREEYEFLTRGFRVIGPDMAIRAARADDIDLGDDDSVNKTSMKQLAKELGANWVVSGTVVEVESKDAPFGKRRAHAKVRMRVLDIGQDGWIVNRYFEDNKDSSSWSGTTGLFRAAIDTTLQRSTSNLLDQYPQTVHVYNEFGEEDYLAGQTTVFTGDPKTPFNGLNNDEGGATGTSSSPASAGQNPPAAPPATASSTGAK